LQRRSAFLGREADEVFLPCLKGRRVLAGGALRVHCEPNRPDDNPDDALMIVARGSKKDGQLPDGA